MEKFCVRNAPNTFFYKRLNDLFTYKNNNSPFVQPL
jgi:hypothetical protein